MDPLGVVSFISLESIAGSSVPPLIISCEQREAGQHVDLLFSPLKGDCQQNNLLQLESQYISSGLLYHALKLLSETPDKWENTGDLNTCFKSQRFSFIDISALFFITLWVRKWLVFRKTPCRGPKWKQVGMNFSSSVNFYSSLHNK